MKTDRLLVLAAAVLLIPVFAAVAAPVESSESCPPATAWQKIDNFLGQQLVAERLASLGLTRTQVEARLVRLSDAQLEQLAGQIDLLQAGGDIEGGNPHPFGPIGCLFRPLGRLLYDIYQLVFCWGDLR